MAIGFTGTRGGLTPLQAEVLCKALWHYRQWFDTMHNGDCVGADEYAGRYWLACGGHIWLHPPTVRAYRSYLPASIQASAKPYLRRNMEIVLSSDVIFACPKESTEVLRSGTWATIRYAKDAGKDLFIIKPDGTTERHKSR